MRAAVRFAGWFLCALAPATALADSCVWVSDEDSIRQVQASANQVTVVVPSGGVSRLIMNAGDCGVWAFNKDEQRLRRYAADGTLELDIGVQSLDSRIDEIEDVQLDPYDESLWLADERRFSHISSAGQLLSGFPTPGEVSQFRVALDQSLWLLGERRLWHFDKQGTPLAKFALADDLAEDARHFAVDSLGGLIWVAGDDKLAQLPLSNPSAPAVRLRVPRSITGLALDPLSGKVWIGQKESLLAYAREGTLAHSIDLGALRLRKPDRLAFDPASRSLWVGAERSVARFTDAGQFVARLAARDGDEALGVPTFRVDPTLVIVRPPQNALTNNPTPAFTLTYGAQCNGEPCPFANDYFAAYQLSATLNAQPVGAQFAFHASAAEATFTPVTRLPEGKNSFSAQATDRFGHQSSREAITFTVDTIPPKFLTLAPAEGSVLANPNILIQGTIDDPTATVSLAGMGINRNGVSFSFPVVLLPGLNTYNLSATDPAGNVTVVVLHLTLATVSVSIASPSNGATINADNVSVSGTFQGPANTGITVNGIAAIVTGSTFIVAAVPLQPGANTLTAVATAPNRQSAAQTVSVTSTGPAPVHVTASIAQGLAPLDVAFTVSNTTGKGLLVVQADFVGSGSFGFFSPGAPLSNRYTAPGTYRAVFNIVDSTGASFRQTVTIVVQDPAQVDQLLRQTWAGFTAALASRDTPQALQYLTRQGKEKYGPVFDVLRPNMTQIVGQFSVLQPVTVGDTVGSYAVNRTVNGVNRLFFVYFLRDADGVWRLDSM